MRGEPCMRKHLFNIILIIVLLAGLGLLLYPTVADYWNSFHQSRAIATYNDDISNLDKDQYNDIIEKAKAYNRKVAQTGLKWLLTDAEKAEYENMLKIGDNSIMGTIEIPRINVSLPIYHGTDEAELQVGIGHLEGTSLPLGTESWQVS